MPTAPPRRALHELARLFGVQTSYADITGVQRHARPEALLGVLRVLGAPLERVGDAIGAVRARREALARRVLEPVLVAGENATRFTLRLPARARGTIELRVALEDGAELRRSHRVGDLPAARSPAKGIVAHRLALPRLPFGYHALAISVGEARYESTVLAAPPRCYDPFGKTRAWGLFAPIYALRSQRSFGAGDFGDFAALAEWTAEHGGVVATLPFFASFLGEPFEPSPYGPVSRLFWNEMLLDIARLPELARAPEAQRLLRAPEVRREIAALRRAPLVEYAREAALKRRVVEALAEALPEAAPERFASFRRWVEAHPAVQDYARFRAAVEERGPWPTWRGAARDGVLRDAGDPRAVRFHEYAQWLAEEQVAALAVKARGAGPGLYLDFPLGVHPDGYDVWRHRSAFALGCSAGAPPDTLFSGGQDWGFPPPHPERSREQGHRYFVACLRQVLRHAGVLRIDHVMGLHRLYFVPPGESAKEGVYVRYPAKELWAVLALESHRYHAGIIGENLGTVPPEVNRALAERDVSSMYVVQYELQPEKARPLRPLPRGSVASLNTHDMPPFAGFWTGADIEDRIALGLLTRESARSDEERREAMRRALAKLPGARRKEMRSCLEAALRYLAGSPARLVLVNLEDLWLEEAPQNVPGTWRERPNWRRRLRYSLEEIEGLGEVTRPLRKVDAARRRIR